MRWTRKPLRGSLAGAGGVNCTNLTPMFEEKPASWKGILVSIPKILILIYCLCGAFSGKTVLPGGARYGSSDLVFSGNEAWALCLFPVLWLSADLIWYKRLVFQDIDTRRLAARTLMVAGLFSIFLAKKLA